MNIVDEAQDGPRLPLDCTWQLAIESSTSEAEIMELARAFVKGWMPGEISRLPKRCRPPRLLNARELSLYTFKLVRGYCAPELKPRAQHEVERMLGFFRVACDRMFELRNSAQRVMAAKAARHDETDPSTSRASSVAA